MKKVDKYGITNYAWWFKLLIPVLVLAIFIQVMGYALWQVEYQAPGANILLYTDAKWVVQMAASTIGFGDFYPVTEIGRDLVATSFYTGIAMFGLIGGVIVDTLSGLTDKSVQNRELRAQNAEIIKLLKDKHAKN